jgi:hypothetical protein
MVGACNMHERDGKYVQNFGREHEGKRYSEDLGIDRTLILE